MAAVKNSTLQNIDTGIPDKDACIVLVNPEWNAAIVDQGEITDGLVQLNLSLPVPAIFGVLTVGNEKQATERIMGNHVHKRDVAGITAL
jgi:6,7-dimethyl-8-ribityllumazine synthase